MNKNIFISFVLAFLFVSCSSLPSKKEMLEKTKNMTLPAEAKPHKTLVYVLRPSAVGGLVRFNVFLDGKEDEKEIGWTRGSQYIKFYLEPGKHKIYSNAENWAEITLDCKPGKIIYLKQDPEMGIIMARNSLLRVPHYEGKYHLLSLQKGTYKNKAKAN